MIPTPPTLAGLFFCLASAEGAGLLFCPAAIQPNTGVYGAFCAVNAIIPPMPQNSAQGSTWAFPAIFRVLLLLFYGASCYIAPPATRWSTPQRRSTSSTYQIPAPRRTLYRPAEPPIIIRYIKSAPLLWIHARRCNIPQTIPARRGQLLPPVDRWQMLHLAHLLRGQCLHLHKVSPAASRYFPSPTACNLAPGQRSGHTLHPVGQSSSRSAAGGAEPLAATAVSLFGLSPDS
jgi:hypothetical protein